MVEYKIEIMPFLYNAAPIPGHLQQNKHLTSSSGNLIVQDSRHIVPD